MSGLKKKGKKALLRINEEEKVAVKVKRLANKIKKKERTIDIFEKTYNSIKKDKVKLEKKLRQALINEESKEEMIPS